MFSRELGRMMIVDYSRLSLAGMWKCFIGDFSFSTPSKFYYLSKTMKPYGRNLCVSFSGGVDSMLILNLCIWMRNRRMIDNIVCVHICYGNKWRSIWERDFVTDYCHFHEVPITVRTITELHRQHGKEKLLVERNTYEELTKDIRFRMYKKYDLPVLLGHNLDDQVENVIANLTKKQQYSNLRGMKTTSIIEGVCIVRPIMNISKDDIFTTSSEGGFLHTKNSTPSWSTRGKTRELLVPFLDSFNPDIIPGLMAVADHLEEHSAYLDSSINSWIETGRDHDEGEVYFTIPRPKVVTFDMIKKCVRSVTLKRGLKYPSLKAMSQLMNTKESFKVKLGENLTTYVDKDKLTFSRV